MIVGAPNQERHKHIFSGVHVMKSRESIFTAHLTTNHPRHLTKACASRRVINPRLHMFLKNSLLVHVLHLGKPSSIENQWFEDEISKLVPFFAEMSIFGRVILQFPQFTHQNLITVIIYMFRLNNAKRSACPLRKNSTFTSGLLAVWPLWFAQMDVHNGPRPILPSPIQ